MKWLLVRILSHYFFYIDFISRSIDGLTFHPVSIESYHSLVVHIFAFHLYVFVYVWYMHPYVYICVCACRGQILTSPHPLSNLCF